MIINVEDFKNEEFTGFIRNLVRTELFNLSGEIPKHSFEALILQQILDKIKEHDKMFCDLKSEISGVKTEVSDLSKKIDDLKSWVGSVVGGFQNRAGKNLEKMVAGTLRLAFKRRDIEPSSIRLRQKFADTDGIIGLKNRSYEIDILVDGDALLVFEIKSLCDLEMAERFADKVTLIKHIHPNKPVSGALISLESDPEVIGYCKTLDIALVS